MPFARPTLTQLRTQAQEDINAAQIGADGFLRNAVVKVLAWVQAGLAHLHYGYLDYIAQQAVPWTATDEYAEGWGNMIGVPRKGPATATGQVTMTGTVGVLIPAATMFVLSGGATYSSTAAAEIPPGATQINVPISATTAGAAGNADAGTSISLSLPIAGIVSAGVVAVPGITGGSDIESDDDYRNRYLAEYAAPPQGGDRNDYIEWALAVPGVTRAWVSPNGQGSGTVVVYTMLDETEAPSLGFPQGINGVANHETRDAQAAGDQLAVANALFAEQPVTALVYSCAPISAPVDFTISGLGADNTEANQLAITVALSNMFTQYAQVGGTVDPSDGSPWDPLDPSYWYTALNALGLSGFNVQSPTGPLTPSPGQLFVLGTVECSS